MSMHVYFLHSQGFDGKKSVWRSRNLHHNTEGLGFGVRVTQALLKHFQEATFVAEKTFDTDAVEMLF